MLPDRCALAPPEKTIARGEAEALDQGLERLLQMEAAVIGADRDRLLGRREHGHLIVGQFDDAHAARGCHFEGGSGDDGPDGDTQIAARRHVLSRDYSSHLINVYCVTVWV